MAKSPNAKKNPLELGDSGVQIFNGIITGEEYQPALHGRQLMRTVEEMRRGDATVHAGLMAVKMPIIATEWTVENGGDEDVDQQAADLIKYNFTQVLNWKAVLTDILTMLDFGFSVFELVFDVRTVDGVDRVVLTKIAFRKQLTVLAWVTQDGQPGITQAKSSGELVSIPDEKLVRFTHQQEGDNYEGVSILRGAYQNWYYKKTLYQIDAVKHERQALGVVKISIPQGKSDKDPDYNNAIRAAKNIRASEQGYVAVPFGWEMDFMDMKAGTTSDPSTSIAHHDRQILKNMAVQYLEIGSQKTSGSFAASSDQRSVMEEQDQAIAEQIASVINDKVVRAIVDLNFNVTDYPKWSVGRISNDDVLDLANAVSLFKGAGILTPTDEDEEHVRSVVHFPDMPEDIKGADRTPKVVPPIAPATDTAPDKTDESKVQPDDVKLDASILDTARQLRAAITEKLYESPNAA